MGSLTHAEPVLQHKDPVREADGGGPLGNDKGQGRMLHPPQGAAKGRVRGVIQGGGAVIQDQDGGLPDEGPGDGQPLTLAAGKIAAPLLNRLIQPQSLSPDYLRRLGRFQGGPQILIRSVRVSPEKIGTDGPREEGSVLGNDAHRRAEGAEGQILDGGVPEEDFTPSLDGHSSKGTLLDVGTAAISTGLAAATIPAVVAFSTATVSVGGLLGFLGVTTTVLVTRNLIAGLVVLGFLFLIALLRFKSIKRNARSRLKARVDKQIIKKIHFSKKERSLAMGMTKMLENTADTLIKELRHG